MRVAVLGGGINGYCCAVQILEHFKKTTNTEVTVISEAFSPNTTGDGSAGLWGPYLLNGTSKSKVHKWSKGMHDFLEQLWLSEDAGEAGVCLIPVIRFQTANTPLYDFWKDIVYGCKSLTVKELETYSEELNKKFTAGLHFVTYTSEPVKLLPYLMKRFATQGGKVKQQKVTDLNDFARNNNYDVIINCTGLGSRDLLNDHRMFPVRGQVSRVKADWLYFVLLDESDDGNYIIPNTTSTVLGGTHQEDNYDTTVSTIDKNTIVDGCRQHVPGLAHAEHICDWVGLRPSRDTLSLEIGKPIENKIVIHNYGHGGSGVTLAWGCAQDVLELLKNKIQENNQLKSKL